MYLDLLNGFGTQTFKNLERFDEAVTHDYRIKTSNDNLYFEIKYRLTVDLNATDDDFAAAGGAKVEILERSIKNKNPTNSSDRTYSYEIKNHKAILNARYTIVNNIKASNDYVNRVMEIGFNLTKKTFSIGSGTTTVDATNKTNLTVTNNSGATTRKFSFTFGVKYIKDKDICDNFCSDQTYGSYLQFYKFAPTNQLGYSADYFSSQINYKFKNEYKAATGIEIADVTGDGNMTTNNYDNSTLFCCCLTLYFLVFKEGGIDVINPFSEEIDVRYRMNNTNSYCGNGVVYIS